MGELLLKLDRTNPDEPVIHVVGPLDNRTATGFDNWLGSYVAKYGSDGLLVFNMENLDILTSRAISSIIYYYDLFKNSGGRVVLRNLPATAKLALDKLGFGGLDLIEG